MNIFPTIHLDGVHSAVALKVLTGAQQYLAARRSDDKSCGWGEPDGKDVYICHTVRRYCTLNGMLEVSCQIEDAIQSALGDKTFCVVFERDTSEEEQALRLEWMKFLCEFLKTKI